MIKGFREFLTRGNVIDLAVAVVIGLAFQAVISAFTDSIIYPIVNVFGGAEAEGLTWQITANEGTTIDFGAVISAVLNFLIVAAAVYFLVVLPFNKIRAMRAAPEEEAPDENTLLLREIRDLLAAPTAAGGKYADSPQPGNPQTGNPHPGNSESGPGARRDPDSGGQHRA